MAVAKIALRSLYYREIAGVLPYTILDTEKHGMGDLTKNQIPTVTPVYGRQPDGTFKVLIDTTEAPGDFDSFELIFLEEDDREVRLLQMMRDQRPIFIERLTFSCPPVNNRNLWKTLEFFKIRPDTGTQLGSPNRDGSDGPVESRVTIKVTEAVRIYKTTLSALSQPDPENTLCIDGLIDPNDCLPGYPGADKIIVIGNEADAAAAAIAHYSMNGGGSFAAFTTDSEPFAEVARNLVAVQTRIIDDKNFRAIFLAGNEATVKVQIAYQDFPVSNAVQTAASWNVIEIAATATDDPGEALSWQDDLGRLYIAAVGDIYVNTDSGATDPGAAKFTGTDAIAQFARDEDNNIWAVGAADLILRELANNRDTFSARVAPAGGPVAISAIAFADDGLMFAGVGTAIFISNDKAETVGGWTSLLDFGASHLIKKIQCKNKTSQCLRIIVDDTTPGTGSVYESEDGGNSFRLVSESSNDGYNDAYFSKDPNKALIVGDVKVTNGVVELLST